MKKATTLLLGLLLFGANSVFAQPTIDGTFDGTSTWGTPVAVSDGSAGWAGVSVDSLFITQDGTYYYFAAKISVADWQSWGFAINTKSGGGTSEVWTYPITYGYFDAPDYVIKGHFGQGGSPYAEVREWSGSTWDLQSSLAGTEFSSDEGNSFVEVRLPKDSLDNPVNLKAQFYVTGNNSSEHATFDAVPDDDVASDWVDSSTLDNYTLPIVEVSGDAGWRLLSMPATGGTIDNLTDDTAIQGITSGDNESADPNFFYYDSTGAFQQPSNVSTAWGDGYGFGLYFFDNTTAGSSELPITLDAVGSDPSSDVTVKLNKSTTSGELNHYFTLVGNPFASNYDLNSMTVDGDGFQDNVHFWNDADDTYETGDRGTGSYIVAPWQGFWVEVANSSTSTTTTFPTSGKTTSDTTATYFSKTVASMGDIQFELSSETTTDKAIRLALRDYATVEFDRADATKMTPLIANYSTLAFASNGILKSVESLPYGLNEEVTIELEQQVVGVSGEFTLAWSGMETIPSDWSVTLYDYETGSSVDLRAEGEYTFTAGSASKAKDNALTILAGPAPVEAQASGSSRFGIVINPGIINSNEEDATPQAFSLEQNYPNPFNPATTIEYSVDKAGAVNLSVYNLMGQKVAELVNEAKSAGSYKVQWNAASAASGMYYYRLEANGASITRKMTLIK